MGQKGKKQGGNTCQQSSGRTRAYALSTHSTHKNPQALTMVNRDALPTRLNSTCISRVRSPTTGGSSLGTALIRVTPSRTRGRMRVHTSSTSSYMYTASCAVCEARDAPSGR
eukprot:1158185-Pelagomonas_calceolata.AAC.9